MNPYFQHTPQVLCLGCGEPMVYVGRGRHECRNPDCTVISMHLDRFGNLLKVLTEGVEVRA